MNLDITKDLKAHLEGKRELRPCHTNRISALDDPCLRRLFYMRHDWEKAEPVSDSLQGVMETGTLLESVIERIVSEAGMAAAPRWRIVGSQTPTKDDLLREYQISGSIDGFLQVEAPGGWQTEGVIDIKTMSPNVYVRVESYDDLARYPWTRKYRGQLMLYSLAHDMDRCFLLLVNKSNLFDMRLIEFPVDMEYCDGLLARAKAVNEAITAGTAPAGVNDPDECSRCQFMSLCQPELASKGNLTFAENEELVGILDRLEQLGPAGAEIKELEDARDKLLTKGQDIVCGDWIITWKKSEIRYKAKEAYTAEQWRKKIMRLAAKVESGLEKMSLQTVPAQAGA